MKHLLWPFAAILSTCAVPAQAQTVTIAPPAQWQECAKEDQSCKAPANSLVRYGAGVKYAYRIAAGTVPCSNAQFGDPNFNVVKTCAYAIPATSAVLPPAVVSPAPAPAPTPTATPTPVPTKPVLSARDKLGINVTQASYWSGEPVYANHAMSIDWLDSTKGGWPGIDRKRLSPTGYPLSVALGTPAVAILNPPEEAFTTATARSRCTWKGTGSVWMGGQYADWTFGDHWIEFRWPQTSPSQTRTWFEIRESKEADPIRDLDCRLVGSDPKALFSPRYLAYIKPYGVLRFLDWTAANANPQSLTFADRSLPQSVVFRGKDGVPIEHIIAVSNANQSSPWLTVPWFASEDYHRGLAKMLHDGIPANKQVYVELSNEVWNYSFYVTRQAEQEGIDRGLSDNRFQAALMRYAQKTAEVMPIYAAVFADRPGQLVRVAATQNDNPWTGEVVLGFPGLAANIDAFATAPYFGHSFFDTNPLEKDVTKLMGILKGYSQGVLTGPVAKNKALANRFGKRYITYEAGQHVLSSAALLPLATSMQRSSLMEGIYRDFIPGWYKQSDDVLTLYSATGPISTFGSWGLREYAGQPLSETPKLRGVLDFAGQ